MKTTDLIFRIAVLIIGCGAGVALCYAYPSELTVALAVAIIGFAIVISGATVISDKQ